MLKIKLKNNNLILLVLLVASTIIMGIGYAAINSVTGEINVTVSAEAQEGVFITNVELVSEVDADTEISNINNYTGTTMNSTVALSTTNPNSEIVYKVTVYNRGEQSSTYLGALYDEEFYDNLGIVFEVEGISVDDEIAPKETKEFTIKFKYKDGVIPESNILNSYINFKFGNPNRLMLANQNDETYLNSGIAREQIEDIKFVYGEVPNTGVISFFDASEKGNESIWGYYTDIDGNGMYELTFTSAETIYTNIDSSYLFYNLTKVKTINFDNFSTKGTENMSFMFNSCYALTSLNSSNFDTNKVKTMQAMFGACKQLTSLDLSKFNTSNVINMNSMFWNCTSLTQIDVSNFDTSNVQDMGGLFGGNNGSSFGTMKLEKIIGLENFDTRNVTDMSRMFQACANLNSLNLIEFDTSKVTTMEGMFIGCYKLVDLNLSSFNTSNVTNMSFMFEYCYKLVDLNLSSFNTSNVINMNSMFDSCTSLANLDLSNFDTSKVQNMIYMFYGCASLTNLDLSSFDTSQVIDMYGMFPYCNSLTNLDLSGFNTSKVTDMYGMFAFNPNLKTIYVSEYDEATDTGWTTKNVTNSEIMFSNCPNLVGGNGTVFDSAHIDKEYARIDKEGQPGYLTNKTPVENRLKVSNMNDATYLNSGVARDKIEDIKFVYGEVPSEGVILQFDASEKQNGSIKGYYTDTDGNGMNELTFTSTEQIYANIDSTALFYKLINLNNITFDNFSTKGTTNMSGMFSECLRLKKIDVSKFDTSETTVLEGMFGVFNDATPMILNEIKGLENFDTSKVISMYGMFMNCINLTNIDVSGFDTSQVKYMSFMFYGCESLTNLDLSNFDTSKVTEMDNMFALCRNLINLNITQFNTSQVTNMRSMFYYCTNLENINVSNFDTSRVTNMTAMFGECTKIVNLDLSNFNTSKVSDFESMFLNCIELQTIYVNEYDEATNTGWTTKSAINSQYMFTNCPNIIGGIGTKFDSAHVDKEYARIDKYGEPGYLTNKKENRLKYADGYIDSTFMNTGVAKENIEDVKFIYGEVPSEGVISQFDASENQDNSIIGYYTDNDGDGLKELTFVSKETIYILLKQKI